jgi:hypothetical protein
MRTQRESDAQGAPRVTAPDVKTLDFTAAPPCHADVGDAGRERALRDLKAWLEAQGADLAAVDFAPCQASRGTPGHGALSRHRIVRQDGTQSAVQRDQIVRLGPSTRCLCCVRRVWGVPQPRCTAAPAVSAHPGGPPPPAAQGAGAGVVATAAARARLRRSWAAWARGWAGGGAPDAALASFPLHSALRAGMSLSVPGAGPKYAALLSSGACNERFLITLLLVRPPIEPAPLLCCARARATIAA